MNEEQVHVQERGDETRLYTRDGRTIRKENWRSVATNRRLSEREPKARVLVKAPINKAIFIRINRGLSISQGKFCKGKRKEKAAKSEQERAKPSILRTEISEIQGTISS